MSKVIVELTELRNQINNYTNNSNFRISNSKDMYNHVKQTLINLNLDTSFEIELMQLTYNVGTYNEEHNKNFNNVLQKIAEKIKFLDSVYDITTDRVDDYKFIYAIMLPKYKHFDDVAAFTKDLNYILSTVLPNNESAKLVGFEKGSEWYQIGVDTYIQFKVFAKFIKQVSSYVNLILNQKISIKELDVDEEAKKLLLENMALNQDLLKEKIVNNLIEDDTKEVDNEKYLMYQTAFERMAKLLLQGTVIEVEKQEVNKDKPEEESLEIPNLENTRKLVEAVKLLTEGNAEEKSEEE